MDEPSEVDEGDVKLVQTPTENQTSPKQWAWQTPDGTCVPLRGDVRLMMLILDMIPVMRS